MNKTLQTTDEKLKFSDITNNIITPYISMKNKIPNDIEKIISPKMGFPKYLSDEEIEIRKKTFDAYNKLPQEIQYWYSIDKNYLSITNAVLRNEEIDKIIELNKENWKNLIFIADRLLCGADAYRDVPAARKLFEYVWNNCPPDVNTDNEYWKYSALQFLAQSYVDLSGTDNYEKNIELFNLLDKEFMYDYEVGKNNYKSPYFWPSIVQRVYSYSMLENFDKVEETYNRFDEAYVNYRQEAPLIKEAIVQLVKISSAIANYNRGMIDKNNLIIILTHCGENFERLANDPQTNDMSKQKNIIDKEQVFNLIKYLKKQKNK